MIKLVGHSSHGNMKQQGIAGLGLVQQVLCRRPPVIALNVEVPFVIASTSPDGKNQPQTKERLPAAERSEGG